MTSLYDVGEAFDPGAVFPTAAYATWRAELRDQNVERLAVTAGRRVEFGDGIAVDVLEPAALNLDNDPAPVAYRLEVGRLSVLVLDREAIAEADTEEQVAEEIVDDNAECKDEAEHHDHIHGEAQAGHDQVSDKHGERDG